MYFNPRSPRGGATCKNNRRHGRKRISIHAPHEGERPKGRARDKAARTFQSTLPTRGSDPYYSIKSQRGQYFNPRSPRGGATKIKPRAQGAGRISIHAPHEGERLYPRHAHIPAPEISIHAPHEGERPCVPALTIGQLIFQSTLPTRGSDKYVTGANAAPEDFNPRSPRGGATCPYRAGHKGGKDFNPRSPRGGATKDGKSSKLKRAISIHAPHEGERRPAPQFLYTRAYFNPRSPRGGATIPRRNMYIGSRDFNPRSPRGGATGHLAACLYRAGISIHAPHEGERRDLHHR